MRRIVIIVLFLAYYFLGSSQNPQRIIEDNHLQNLNYHWSSDTTYVLEGLVYLESGGSLIIDPGTIIKARKNPLNGDPVSALIIADGARLEARGSYFNPVIFTSDQDDLQDPFDLSESDRGLWGGVLILGNAPVQVADSEDTRFRFGLVADDERAAYGGTQMEADNGFLSNVSIRYAGAEINGDHFPGLGLAGVGNVTVIDSVEVFACAGDGFQFIGGSVDSRFLSSSFNGDDAFDWDAGYIGRGQFWFGIQARDQADCGIEGKGKFSGPTIYNVTLIGPGKQSQLSESIAIRFKDQSAGEIGMGIFTDYPNKGLEIEDLPGEEDSYTQLEDGNIHLYSNIWSEFGAGDTFLAEDGFIEISSMADDPEALLVSNMLRMDTNYIRENHLPYLSRSQNKMLYPDDFIDPFDFSNSPVIHYPSDSFFIENIDFCLGHGAFITEGAWWLRYWTAMDQNDYLMHPCALGFFRTNNLDYVGGDTIIIYCEDIENLPSIESYECINSKCILFNQSLALAMRMKRKKQRFDLPDMPYCYMQSIVYQGFEDLSQINPDGSISLIRNIDTFEVVLNLLVVDTSAPVFITSFCDTCASFPFEVGITDCDTSWITSFDSVQMANGVVEYNWYGQDRCGNFSVYTIVKDLSVEPTLYFEDLDQDGFGNSDRTFLWSGVIPGIATRGGDCDDQNPDRFPGNEDDPFDNFDNDCEGTGHHETCNLSEQIRVSSSCQFQTFQVYESFLEYMDNTCTSLFDLWDGDLWFRIDPGNAQDFNLEIDLDDPISALNVYQGTCEALELIACSEYGDSTLTVSGYSSNETLMLQVALSNIYEGSLGICTQSNSLTSSLHEVDPIPIRVYPNPVLDQQRLEFELTRPALVEVQIVNALGQIIDQEDPVLFDVGYHQMFLDFGNIPAGTYWIIVNHDGFRSSMKSIKF